jgi:hypothetical protein
MCYLHIRADLSLINIIYDDVRILKLGGKLLNLIEC